MTAQAPSSPEAELAKLLIQTNYLFRDLEINWLAQYLSPDLTIEKLYSNRPVYTAFRPNIFLDVLYIILSGGQLLLGVHP